MDGNTLKLVVIPRANASATSDDQHQHQDHKKKLRPAVLALQGHERSSVSISLLASALSHTLSGSFLFLFHLSIIKHGVIS